MDLINLMSLSKLTTKALELRISSEYLQSSKIPFHSRILKNNKTGMRISQRKRIFFPDPMFGIRVYLTKIKIK